MTASFIQNFTVANQTGNASVGTTASAGALLMTTAQTAAQSALRPQSSQYVPFPDIAIANYGTSGAQVALGTTPAVVAINTAAVIAANPATGSTQVYVPAGTLITVSRNGNTYWSAITDSNTTSLVIMTGQGS